MSAEQNHIVLKRTIHLAVPESGPATRLMDAVCSLWQKQLAADTEKIFTTHCPSDRQARLGMIVLDLGMIAEADLPHRLPDLYRAALEAEVRRLLAQRRTDDPAPLQSVEASTLAALEHVLVHGVLPWWCHDQERFDPPARLLDELGRAASEVAALVRRIGRQPPVRFRLIDWLPDSGIADLIRALTAGDAEFVLRYAEDLERRQREKPFVPARATEFRQAKWEVILAHLLGDRGSRFNRKSFLRQTLHALAARFSLHYEDLLNALMRVADNPAVAWQDSSLPKLLLDLRQEDLPAPDAARTPQDPGQPAEEVADLVELWRAALRERPWTWSPAQRARLAFWRRVPGATAREVLAPLADQSTLPGHLAALCAPDQLASLREILVAGGPDAEPLLLDVATAIEASPAHRSFDEWIEVWDRFLAQGGHHSDFGSAGRLAFWRTFPPDKVAEGIHRLLTRHGVDTVAACLAAEFTGDERADLIRVVVGAPLARGRNALDQLVEQVADGSGDENPARGSPRKSAPFTTALWALRLLLETGSLPSTHWARRWHARREEWLRLTLARDPEIITAQLQAWARNGTFTELIAQRRSDEILELLVETVSPVHANEIRAFVAVASRVDRADGLSSLSSSALRASVWKVTLDFLLVDRGSVFNNRTFLRQSIARLAARHNLGVLALLRRLISAAIAQSRHRLLRDLRDLAQDSDWAGPTAAPFGPSAPFGTATPFDLAGFFGTAASYGPTPPSGVAGAAGTTPPSELAGSSDAGAPDPHRPLPRDPNGGRHREPDNSDSPGEPTSAPETGGAPALSRHASGEPASDLGRASTGGESTADRVAAAMTAGGSGDNACFTPALLKHSAFARLRLFRLCLIEAPMLRDKSMPPLLGGLWPLLLAERTATWHELLGDASWSVTALGTILRTGGASVLEAAVFAGQPSELEVWRESLAWLNTGAEAAVLFPGGRDNLEARLWRALLDAWREAGGRPISDLASLLAMIVAAASLAPRRTERTTSTREAVRAALERDGSATATKLAARLSASAVAAPPRRPAPPESSAMSASDTVLVRAGPAGNATNDPICVANAGLVLLAPFFPELHRRCGLLVDGKFPDVPSRQHAVHLLQFLAVGDRRSFEHSLALNKILCGLAPGAAIAADIKLTDGDRREGQLLLENITRQLLPHGAMSVEGLRGSYLHRPGQLERRETGWLLRVERRGWDVLLAEVPWSFSQIRVTWMPELLQVDWI